MTWLSALEAQPDPIWLRTLATVLPVLGTTVAALVAGPWLVEKVKQSRNPTPIPTPSTPTPEQIPAGQGLPAPVALEATARAQEDPLIRLFINDLHTRLDDAHRELSEVHGRLAVSAATIARLEADLTDKTEKVEELERELQSSATQNSYLRQRYSQLTGELEMVRRKLAICMEGYEPKND